MHQVYVDQDACKGTDECGICAWVCPTEVFDTASHLTSRGIAPPVVARIADCVGCENCMLYCPDLAIVVVKSRLGYGMPTQSADACQAVRGTP